jgi:hypothetical protein
MIGLGLLGGIGHFALIKAFQFAPAATVTPFGYSNLIWAVLFGYLIFGDLPDGWTVSGALVSFGPAQRLFTPRLQHDPRGSYCAAPRGGHRRGQKPSA